MKKIIITSLVLSTLATTIISCKKDSDNSTPTSTNNGTGTTPGLNKTSIAGASSVSLIKALGGSSEAHSSASGTIDNTTKKFFVYSSGAKLSATMVFGTTVIPAINKTFTVVANTNNGLKENEVYIEFTDYEDNDKEYVAQEGTIDYKIAGTDITIKSGNLPAKTNTGAAASVNFEYHLK